MIKLPYQDVSLSIEERIDDLMERMSIEEKVKQLTCAMYIPVMPIDKQDLKDGIGSFTIMGSQDVAGDIRKAQEYVIEHSKHSIPALVHGEALSGPVSIPAANLFPTSISLGATFEPEMAEKMSEGTSSPSLKSLCKYYGMNLSSGSISASAISSAVMSSVL